MAVAAVATRAEAIETAGKFEALLTRHIERVRKGVLDDGTPFSFLVRGGGHVPRLTSLSATCLKYRVCARSSVG